MKIILGSSSKNRRHLLESWGIEFEMKPANIDEKVFRAKDIKQLSLVVARAKAESLKAQIKEPAIVIVADSVVEVNNQLREKPVDEAQAMEYLRSYGSDPVMIHSAVVVFNSQTHEQREFVDTAKLYFKKFSEHQVQDLVAHGEVLGGAGALIVSSPAIKEHIVHLEGSWDTAIGLPKEMTLKFIQELTNN